MKKTLHGPGGLTLVLDSAEIFPDDPGQGTPAMVYLGRNSATYGCAVHFGELDCGEKELSATQVNWLDAQEEIVWTFIEENSPK